MSGIPTIKGPRDPGNLPGLGSQGRPVRLDPWTNIVEVGWNNGWGSVDLASIDTTTRSPVNTPEGPVTGPERFSDLNAFRLSYWIFQQTAGDDVGALFINSQDYNPITPFGFTLEFRSNTFILHSSNGVMDGGFVEAADFDLNPISSLRGLAAGWNNILLSVEWELAVGAGNKQVTYSAAICNRDAGIAGDFSVAGTGALMNVYHTIPATFSDAGWVISSGGAALGQQFLSGPQMLPGYSDFTDPTQRRLFNDVIGTTGKLGAKNPLKNPDLAPFFFFRGDTKGGKSDPASFFATNRATGKPWTVEPGTILVGGPTLPTVPGQG